LIVAKRSLSACGQKSAGEPSYSAVNTALPSSTKGLNLSHSSYSKHSSTTAKSKIPTSAGTWSGSFLSATAIPRRWTSRATQRLKRSWSAPLSGKPVLFS
jgi:hypothetical protein